MANKDSAFGLRPIGKVGQNRDNQGLSEYDIAASATAIFQNDPVEMAATGTITVAAATDTLLGSLNGVFFTDASTSKPTFANHLKGSNTATDIKGFVSDDPYERFEIQSDDATAAADVGLNADIVYASGATPNFISKVELDHSDLKTGTAQLRVLGISKDINNNEAGSANVNLVVMINEHFLKGTTGI
jgi:hypothetical protein|tara:strand:+ start:313 stop:876 length:564 start_codon:yes stop_codon:yes gene_type:complete